MSDGFATCLGAGAVPGARERADDEKTTLEQGERWATLVGARLSALPPLALAPSAPEEAGAWHSGAGDLTPATGSRWTESAALNGPQVDGVEAADASENRMIVRVDGCDLGEVALVVDCHAGAIRVTISAADAGAEAALG